MGNCEKLLGLLRNKSAWIRWITRVEKADGRQTYAFLITCCSHLGDLKTLGNRVRNECDENNLKAMVFELVTHELLYRLGLTPTFQPRSCEKTPDLAFQGGGTTFLADAFFVLGSVRSEASSQPGIHECPEDDEREDKIVKRIRDRVEEKGPKYVDLGQPIVLFSFIFDHGHSNPGRIQGLLLGEENGDGLGAHRGILMPWEDGSKHYRNVSAFVIAEWFQKPGPGDHERLLSCAVLHNPCANVPLPVSAFDRFQQLVWFQPSSGAPQPRLTRDDPVSVRFLENGGMQCV